MTATEEQLLRQLHEGPGDDALRALYALHGEALYGFAVRRLGDRGLAEELVQDVFTRVWRHAGDFDPERASFRTWLYQIARNAAIDVERRRMVRPSLSSESASEEPTEPDEPIERAVLRWQMEAALERLGPDHREVLRLAHFEGLTMREIGDRLGIPVGTVKSRTSYALRILRLALDEREVAQ